MGYEFELKFQATPQRQTAVLEAFSGWETYEMETAYYDTHTKDLSRLRYTLRRRLENGRSVCTLKTPAGKLGRGEWETESPSIEEAIPELCKLGCPAQLPELIAGGLIQVCGARFTRRATRITWQDSLLEIAVDSGILFGGSREIPLCEIEVELKSGPQAQAIAFAKELEAQFSLTPQLKSKFRRALALTEGE